MDAMGRGPGICFCVLTPRPIRDRVSLVPRTSTFPLFDQIVGGDLDKIIDGYRNDGLGSRAIAKKLHDDHDIDVSYRTVARWIAR